MGFSQFDYDVKVMRLRRNHDAFTS